jgi:hypothetical protein
MTVISFNADDSLYDENDTLVDGSGGDILENSAGNTYIYRHGDGNDTISNHASTGALDCDKLSFGESIHAEDITASRSGNNLMLTLNDGSGSVNIQNWYSNNNHYKLDEITFADGVVWKASNEMSVENWFQEQKELSAASSLLTEESSNPFGFSLFGASKKNSVITADLNMLKELRYDQMVTEIALASLQMMENMAMVSSMNGSDLVVRESILANIAVSGISKKPFSDKL